jgi:hypothetical protein
MKQPETEQHRKAIGAIVRRYRAMLRRLQVPESDIPKQGESIAIMRRARDREDLNVERLLTMSEPDFGHDVGGILKFADKNGKLTRFFWPRCGSMVEARRVKRLVAHFAAKRKRESKEAR